MLNGFNNKSLYGVVRKLIVEGKLKTEDKLMDLLQDLKLKKMKQITVHDLLLHTSGLPNELDRIHLKKLEPREIVAETLKTKATNKYSRFNCPNLDYYMSGLIIESVTNISKKVNVSQRIIEPLQLSNTGFSVRNNESNAQVLGF